jgi:acyl transferase domain-containing protein
VLHYSRLNPNIVLKGTPFVIPTALQPWPRGERPHLAAVSSFGMSGTNAHIILEGVSPMPPAVQVTQGPSPAPHFRLIPISAHTRAALGVHAAAWHDFFSAGAGRETSLDDVAYTASRRRSHLEYRLAGIARTREQLIGSLASFVDGASAPDVLAGQRAQSRGPVFVFTGQGGQWLGMGRQLLEQEPVFRASLERTAEVFQKLTGWSLLSELTADAATSRLGEIDVCQPVLFAVEVALADLWRSWGIEPAAVVGHSRGEITASYVAGTLSLEAAARIMCRRSSLMRRLSGQGGMAVVGLPGAELFRRLAPYRERLTVAVLQSPSFTVVAGEQIALEELVTLLEREDVFCRRVNVDVASHCPQVEVLRDDLLAAIDGIEPHDELVPFYSTVTAGRLPGNTLNAAYWYRNLREPVRFAETLAGLAEEGYETFLEISPHPILLTAIEQVYEHLGEPALLLPSLHRDEDERLSLLRSLAALHVRGHAVRWEALEPAGQCITLPRFPWQNQRYPVRAVSVKPAEPPDDRERGRPNTRDGVPPVGSPDEVVPTGEAGGTVAAALSAPDDHVYELTWQLQDSRGAADAELPDAWLILADPGGTGEALASRLEGRGRPCQIAFVDGGQTVTAPEAQFGDGPWRLDPASRETYQQLLGATGTRFGRRRLGIVHLWSLDVRAHADLSVAELKAAQVLGCFSVLHLLQALPSTDAEGVRLWLVTRGAQRVSTGEGPGQPEQSPLWGAGRVLAREHPELWGGLIDLEPAGPWAGNGVAEGNGVGLAAANVEEALTLLEAVEAGDGEDEVALRGGRRYVPRLRHAGTLSPPTGELLRADATYLIVGGLGGIGLEIARWMVERGARTIVLAGRSGATDRARPMLEALDQAGARILCEAVDVSNRDSVATLLGRIEQTLPPLRGIIHSAAVLSDGVMLRLTQEQFETAFAPKVAGAWNLHLLTRHLPLDFFTLFSSATSLIGLLGHATYAASNAFLDALAHHRRALGLSAQTINWGVWERVGVAVRANAQREVPGAEVISSTEGLWLLERLLRLPGAQWVVLPMNWAEYFRSEVPGEGLPLLSELRGAFQAAVPQAAPGEAGLHHRLKAASPGERLHLLSVAIRESVAAVLGFGPDHLVDPACGFFQMGMDSLRAVELKNRLQTRLGMSLSSTVIFDHPTIDALSGHLLRILFPAAPTARPAGEDGSLGARMKSVLGQVKTLDREELRRMLHRP